MIKALGAKLYAAWSHHKNEKWIKTPLETQEKVLKELIKQGAQTRFGKDHNFEKIKDLKTYQKEVSVRDYEGFKPYIDAILEGENMCCGKEDLCITPNLAERHRGRNTFLSQKLRCHSTYEQLGKRC